MKFRTVKILSIFIFSFIFASNFAFAKAYKCKIDGRTVYQDFPCANAEKVNLSGAGKDDPTSNSALQAQLEIARAKRIEKVEAAIGNREVIVGMTADEVIQSWGSPDKINKTVTSSGLDEQWIYRRKGVGNDQYVYLENGVVRTIQLPQ